MKITLTAVLLATFLTVSATAGAAPPQTNSHADNAQRDFRHVGDRRDFRDPRPGQRYDDWRNDHRSYWPRRYRAERYNPPRGFYERNWRRGDRLPRVYRAQPYVVYSYRTYHLYDPPRGYRWVRVRNDVLLTAIATGVVLDAVYNLYY